MTDRFDSREFAELMWAYRDAFYPEDRLAALEAVKQYVRTPALELPTIEPERLEAR